jgi:hypothetical protein
VDKFSEYVAVNLAGVSGTLKTKWCKIPAFLAFPGDKIT